MEKKYEHSLAFDETFIESINSSIKENIDCRLYLTAYYKPKRISADTSSEHAFWVAVTNIYGFFSDCSGYIEHDFLTMLKRQKLLKSEDFKRIKEFISIVEDIRSLFCHNMSTESLQTEEHLKSFNNFIQQILQTDISPVSIPYQLHLRDSEWEKLTISLSSEFQENMQVLAKAIDRIVKHISKEEIINEWIGFIAKWYENPILFKLAAAPYYRLLSQMDNINYPLTYYRKNSWIQERKNEWEKNGISYIKEQKEPILPYQILSSFFYDAVNKSCSK